MPEMTTGELIKKLQEKDPSGKCVVSVDAENGGGEDIEVLTAAEYGDADLCDKVIVIRTCA